MAEGVVHSSGLSFLFQSAEKRAQHEINDKGQNLSMITMFWFGFILSAGKFIYWRDLAGITQFLRQGFRDEKVIALIL